ncbi:S-layer homology domain-containing protein [Calothrix sp. 336/3]|uniref:S-layer homology domain-containing protein n=1 Tax=Calothrix sp. 336/3 TaxID=1337936 RepID=UPI0004E3956E|nr:S-layer homology domain-containing protein [Calothrix sp. 336/3]AKG23891.1 S-layer protein [Calothrix sp. 336/3]
MFNSSPWQSRLSAGIAASMTLATVTPFFLATPSFAQTSFSDIPNNYWAAPFIQELSQRGIVSGFPDGRFRPEEKVTRAQFAAMLNKAFSKPQQRQAIRFADVPSNSWAYRAIQQSYTTGFLSGYPGNFFEPNQNIPRQQVLVSLANGLGYTSSGNVSSILQNFNDASEIAGYARQPIAAATEQDIVVNYPNVRFLNPTSTATRAQVAAFIYQALVSSGKASAINSPYIFAFNNQTPPPPVAVNIPAGTVIPVKYDKAEQILVTKDETAPLTLTVAQNVITDRGSVVIPAGSQVVGNLKPVKNKLGSQFIAQKLVLTTGEEYDLKAASEVITKTKTVKKGDRKNAVIKNSVMGAAAAAAVASVTGDRAIATEEILGGAGIGALIGIFFGQKSVDLIAIDPDTDLQMTIDETLQVSLK